MTAQSDESHLLQDVNGERLYAKYMEWCDNRKFVLQDGDFSLGGLQSPLMTPSLISAYQQWCRQSCFARSTKPLSLSERLSVVLVKAVSLARKLARPFH